MTLFPITAFHNPDCGTSRNTAAMIRAAGYEPETAEYPKAGWTLEQLHKGRRRDRAFLVDRRG